MDNSPETAILSNDFTGQTMLGKAYGDYINNGLRDKGPDDYGCLIFPSGPILVLERIAAYADEGGHSSRTIHKGDRFFP